MVSYLYLKRVLQKHDIKFLHAEDGDQAIKLVKSNPEIDLVLMDIRMPLIDGLEATKIIKKLRPELPIIAQTAYAFKEERTHILSIGCDEYLVKPIEESKLLVLLNKFLN